MRTLEMLETRIHCFPAFSVGSQSCGVLHGQTSLGSADHFESPPRPEASSLSKVILVWKKPEVTGHQIWAVGGLSHLGDLMFCQKNSARDVMYELAHCRDEAANHRLPIAVAF